MSKHFMKQKQPKISKESLRKIIIYIFGINILALGIGLIVKSNLGAAPWDLLCVSLSQSIGLTVGNWQIICNISMLFAAALLTKKLKLEVLIPGILAGFLIDSYLYLLKNINMHPYFLLVTGILASGLGLALYVNQGLPANAIDNFTYQLHKKFTIDLSMAKIYTDCIPIAILILFFWKNMTLIVIVIYIAVPMAIKLWEYLLRNTKLL